MGVQPLSCPFFLGIPLGKFSHGLPSSSTSPSPPVRTSWSGLPPSGIVIPGWLDASTHLGPRAISLCRCRMARRPFSMQEYSVVIGRYYCTGLLQDIIVRACGNSDSVAGAFRRVDGRCVASVCASLGMLWRDASWRVAKNLGESRPGAGRFGCVDRDSADLSSCVASPLLRYWKADRGHDLVFVHRCFSGHDGLAPEHRGPGPSPDGNRTRRKLRGRTAGTALPTGTQT